LHEDSSCRAFGPSGAWSFDEHEAPRQFLTSSQEACLRTGQSLLHYCSLYVTIEPCTMCYGAASLLHIREIVYGAGSPKFGACGGLHSAHQLPGANHKPMVTGGICAEQCTQVMQDFFKAKRQRGAQLSQPHVRSRQ